MSQTTKVFNSWSESGIDFNPRRTGEQKTLCPNCSHTRKNKSDKCLSLNIGKGVANCHNCDFKAVIASEDDEYMKSKEYTKPDIKTIPISEKGLEFFKSRGIEERTLEYFKIGQEKRGITFPYYEGTELVNVKFRAPGKKFQMAPGAKLVFFNLNAIAKSDEVIITEGEIDCMSLYQCNLFNSVSVPNGASKGNQKLEYLDNCIDYFEGKKKIILATDDDEAGIALQNELIRRLGYERCYTIEYPDGCKDANEVLLTHGDKAVKVMIRNAAPIPIEGIVPPDDMSNMIEYLHRYGYPSGDKIGYNRSLRLEDTKEASFDDIMSFGVGELTMVTGIPGHGKALALDTMIPTPSGWVTMGALKVGDIVFNEKGKACRVTNATGVMHDRECYKIVFSDGSIIICDANHNWYTRDDKARRSLAMANRKGRDIKRELKSRGTDQSHLRTFPSVKTTEEISRTLYVENGKRVNHCVPVAHSLEMPLVTLPIPPYTLGAWLGDGTSQNGGFTCNDPEIITYIEQDGYLVTKQSRPYGYGIIGLMTQLNAEGLIQNKHIPKAYLRASAEQRLDLLKGLMDTDGFISKDRQCEFTSTKRGLAEGVFELAVSLGQVPKFIEARATLYGKDCGQKFRVIFTPTINVFKLARKADRGAARASITSDIMEWRRIVACDPIDSVPVRCIEVDSDSHLFLCGKSMIPTHNSNFVDQIMTRLAARHGWRFGIFSFEQPADFQGAAIIEKYIGESIDPKYAHNHMSELKRKRGTEFLNEHFHFVKEDGVDTTIEGILEKAREMVMRYGIKGFLIDPYNYIEYKAPGQMSETQYICWLLNKIKSFCRIYKVSIFLVAHPTKMGKDKDGNEEVPNLYSIAGSAHFRNITDNGICVYRNYNTDEVSVQVQKIRWKSMGKIGFAVFNYDIPTGRYMTPGYDFENEMRDPTQTTLPIPEPQPVRMPGELTDFQFMAIGEPNF